MTVQVTIPPLYLELAEVATLTTLSESTIQAMVTRGEFPAPRELSGRRVAWLYREVMEWAEQRPVSAMLPPKNTGARRPRSATGQPAPQDSQRAA